MGKVTLVAAFFFSVISCELVVSPEDEVNLSSEYLLDNAEVVSRYQQEGRCPDVQDEVGILLFFLQLFPPRQIPPKNFPLPDSLNISPHQVQILRYFVQLGPNERQERNVGAVVSPGHVVEHKYSWSDESWLPQRQRIE